MLLNLALAVFVAALGLASASHFYRGDFGGGFVVGGLAIFVALVAKAIALTSARRRAKTLDRFAKEGFKLSITEEKTEEKR